MSAQMHQRIDLATEQLDVALQLFLDKRSYVSALSLAGAAEEIFGKALDHQGKEHSLKYKFDAIAPIHHVLNGAPLAWRNFADDENRARNAAKHMRIPADATVTMDIEDAALWMIVRAIDNFERLGLAKSDRICAFENWFYAHVVGV